MSHTYVCVAEPSIGGSNPDSIAEINNVTKIINCDNNQNNLPMPPKIPAFSWKGTGLVTFWFDDSWISQYNTAFPLMEKYGYKGAVAVAVKLVCYPAFMNWDQLRILQNRGWETTAHTVMHNCDLGYYTTKITQYELGGSKQMIQSHGLRADQFVMPCGYNREQLDELFEDRPPPIIQMAKKYFMSYRSTHYQRLNPIPVVDPFNLNAFQLRNTTTDSEIQEEIDKAVTEHSWLIIVIHQIDNTNRTFSITPDEFTKILSMVQASHLPVVLPTQVLAIKKSS